MWIGVAAVLTLSACLAFMIFANRDNPSAVPTLAVGDLQTAVVNNASPTPPASAQFVELSLNPRIQGNLLIVEGRTDLPNRALLMYEASEIATNPMVANGTMPVQDSRYLRQVDITGWHAGTIAVWVGFQILLGSEEKQPEEIIERFGEMGEFLYGDNVTENGGFKRVEVRERLEFLPP